MPGFLSTIWQQRSLENPSTPLSAPDDWLFDALGSFRASSGVNVNRETALTYDAYWRCIGLLSGDVAKLPLHVYKHDAKGVKTHDDDHPADYLLCYEFNEDICALDCKRVLTFHAIAEGNGYGYIVRGADARPLEIWPLSPMKTYPVRQDQVLWYITEVGAKQRKIPADDMLHIKGLSFDGLVGYSAVAKMREALGLGLAAENFGNIFFRNNARPNVVLKHPGRLKPEAKLNIRESWERIHSGLENAHRTAVLEEGMDIVPIMHNARDSQLLELRQFSRIQICNFFGVPPHKVGDGARTSYNSLEQENQEYLNDGGGLGFWLAAWESECRKKLLTVPQKQRRTHTVEFNKRKLLRADLQVRTQYYTSMIQQGVLCPDEVRAEEGMNPRPDGKGGDFVTPTAPQQAKGTPGAGEQGSGDGGQGSGKDKPTTAQPALPPPKAGKKKPRALPAAVAQAHRELVLDAARRIGRRVATHARRAAGDPKKFMAFVDAFSAEHRSVAAAALKPALAAIAAATGESADPVQIADQLLAGYREELLGAAGNATAAQLAERVNGVVHLWETQKPAALADQVLARGKKPTRTTDEALALLDAMPDVDPSEKDRVAVTMPVNEEPPYDIDPEDMDGKTEKKTVRISRLIATRAIMDRKRLESFIKTPDENTEGKDVGKLPTDRPYVVKCEGELYLYDGNHRVMARQLLGATRVKVYLFKEGDQ